MRTQRKQAQTAFSKGRLNSLDDLFDINASRDKAHGLFEIGKLVFREHLFYFLDLRS